MTAHQAVPLGTLLKSYRTSAGMSQEELAEAANVSVRSIGDLERGVQRTPYRDTVRALADALGLQGTDRESFVSSARGPRRRPSDDSGGRPLPTGNFLGARPEGSLVGRQAELHQIESVVDGVCAGAGQLVLLAGEPGIGKTRLAQEMALALRERGFLVATGSCYEFHQTVPYAPFLDVLATAAATAPPAIRAGMEQRWPLLNRLLAETSQTQPAEPAAGPEEQQRLFRAVTAFLLALAELLPVGLLFDDLHWADVTSLALLHHLARTTRGHPIFLLGTHRTAEIDRGHPLARTLLDLERAEVVRKVAMRRLSEDDTASLAANTTGRELPEEARQLIYARTEGNPFFVRQLVQALLEDADDGENGERWIQRGIQEMAVPESVRGLIGQRVARLGTVTRTVLQQASVLGQTFAFDELLLLGRHDEQGLEEALVEAVSGGLVQEIEDDRYAFDHALTQQVLYDGLSTHRRRALHRAAAEALERRSDQTAHQVESGRAADLARHFQKGADPERALPYSMLAGDEAQRVFANEEAELHYRVALQLARAVGDQEVQARALERLGGVLTTRARYAEALQVLERSAGLLRRLGDGEGECRVSAEIAAVHTQKGTPEEALPILQSSLQRFENRAPSRGLVAVYVALADLYMARGERAQELAAAESAAELARVVDDELLTSRATIVYGFALLHFGSADRGLQTLEEACRLAEKTGDLSTIFHAWELVGGAYRDRAEFARSAEYAQGVLEIAERLGEPTLVASAIAERGRIAMYTGEWERARSDLQRAVAMNREIGEHRELVTTLTLTLLGEFHERAGDLDLASRCLEEALDLSTRAGYGLSMLWAQYHLALLDLRQGRPTEARARILPLADRLPPEDSALSASLSVLARIHHALGDGTAALHLSRQAVAAARAGRYRLSLVEVLLVQGAILAGQGEAAEADGVLQECLAMARDMPYPYVEASALHERGLVAAHRGDPGQAREQLEEALTIFQRLGARWDMERTRQALAVLG